MQLFFDPLEVIYKWRAIPDFISNVYKYQKLNTTNKFSLKFSNLFFVTYEKYMPAGIMQGHYFFQDIWAAEKVYSKKPEIHVDIASRIDGFVAHILPFCKVEYVDIRKITSTLPNLIFKEGSILQLPYADNSVKSLSCLHVIEHIGLGRYGDPIDPQGHIKAAQEMMRILEPGGSLFLGTPIGRERVCFDAHRVFYVESIISMFNELKIIEFSMINDKAMQINYNANYIESNKCQFGCGLFEFVKPV